MFALNIYHTKRNFSWKKISLIPNLNLKNSLELIVTNGG